MSYSEKIHEHVVLKADLKRFIELRRKHFSNNDIPYLVKSMGLNDIDMIEDMEQGVKRIDDRTYSLFLLICGEHPNYKLIDKQTVSNSNITTPLAIKPPSTGEAIRQYREDANFMRQGKMAWLLGLSSKKYVSYYENQEKTNISPSIQCWTLFLLIINQHRYFKLEDKKYNL